MKKVIGILSGGTGGSLWPLSRPNYPKQFHNLSGSGAPLIVDTIRRFDSEDHKVVITTKDLVPITGTVLHRMNLDGVEVLAEPEGRGTLPALMLFVRNVLKEGDAVCGLVASDIVVKNEDVLRSAMQEAMSHAEDDKIVSIIGTNVKTNNLNIGYALVSKIKDSLHKVHSFIEKPDSEEFSNLKSEGQEVLANMGYVFFTASKMSSVLEQLFGETWISFRDSDDSNLESNFADLGRGSFEKGVLEKLTDLYSIKADIDWHDIGCWDDDLGSMLSSDKVEISSFNNDYIHLHTKAKPVVFVGIEETVVVDTPDALLVMKKGQASGVSQAIARLGEDLNISLPDHAFEERPWGRFEILLDMEHFKSKRLIVLPGKKLSYQRHQHRNEQWTIVRGVAEVTINDKTEIYNVGDHVEVPAGAKHRIANPSEDKLLEFIEVQTGSYFGEDDIERFEDDFGRS